MHSFQNHIGRYIMALFVPDTPSPQIYSGTRVVTCSRCSVLRPQYQVKGIILDTQNLPKPLTIETGGQDCSLFYSMAVLPKLSPRLIYGYLFNHRYFLNRSYFLMCGIPLECLVTHTFLQQVITISTTRATLKCARTFFSQQYFLIQDTTPKQIRSDPPQRLIGGYFLIYYYFLVRQFYGICTHLGQSPYELVVGIYDEDKIPYA